MPLRIHNTLTREKQPFEPLHPGRVNMYVCGPTVYDYPHLGHAKSYLSFDIAVRYLRYLGNDVLYVQNITDVGHLTDDADEGEDKVQKRARERRIEPMALVETFTREYFTAMDRLNCLRPDISPRATGHVPEMIDLISRLIDEGHAYVSDGNVYFEVESFSEYGKLSHRRLEDQEAGGRVEPGAGKRSPVDFALWKSAEGTGHLMRWNSPWGVGFPGWHIECSAMSMKYLGETIDIHGAGVDNIFPHNEDEIAQAECATHRTFARYWMHNGTVLVDGEKMSKSKGNFVTIEEAIGKFGAQAIRYWVVASHYRSPILYTEEGIREASRALERLQIAVVNAERYLTLPESHSHSHSSSEASRSEQPSSSSSSCSSTELERHTASYREQFLVAMDDDFNTPSALAALFGLSTELNRVTAAADDRTAEGSVAVQGARDLMLELSGEVLGLQLASRESTTENDITGPLVEMILTARQSLRKHRDFGAADEIRGKLNELGIVVEDRNDGSTWRRGR